MCINELPQELPRIHNIDVQTLDKIHEIRNIDTNRHKFTHMNNLIETLTHRHTDAHKHTYTHTDTFTNKHICPD